MASSERLHAYAIHLFSLALKAQDDGDVGYVDRLTARAAQYLDEAAATETPAKPKE